MLTNTHVSSRNIAAFKMPAFPVGTSTALDTTTPLLLSAAVHQMQDLLPQLAQVGKFSLLVSANAQLDRAL
jgi:hypothetical protein